MTYHKLKLLAILLPTIIIGGFEYIRHHWLLPYLSMETGNLYITILTFNISYLFASWMFHTIEKMNQKIADEKAKMAVYEERERLARELHDNIAQTLFFLNVQLKQGDLKEAKAAVNEMDSHLRQAIFNLRTLPDEGLDLAHRLKKWLEEWTIVSNIEVIQEIEIPKGFFSPREEILLFGIVQESFTNIRKHARASQAQLTMTAHSRGWNLSVTDNGKRNAAGGEGSKKFGLSMIEESAKKLGAKMEWSIKPEGGSELRIYSD